MGHFIYVVGGFDGKRQLSSVERYDTERQEWQLIASIKIARSALSLTALDGKLYAMGGYDGTNFLTIVEVYDPLKDMWTDGVPLTSGRSGHAAASGFKVETSKMSEGQQKQSINIERQETASQTASPSNKTASMLGGSSSDNILNSNNSISDSTTTQMCSNFKSIQFNGEPVS